MASVALRTTLMIASNAASLSGGATGWLMTVSPPAAMVSGPVGGRANDSAGGTPGGRRHE